MKIKKYILPGINILISVLGILSLLIFRMSENVIYIMMMTVMIGWIIPYFVPLITGIALINKSHYKRALVLNIVSILMIIFLIVMIKILYDKKMLFMLVTYIIFVIINIVNSVYIGIIVKSEYEKNKGKRQKEKEKLKKMKEENNGAII